MPDQIPTPPKRVVIYYDHHIDEWYVLNLGESDIAQEVKNHPSKYHAYVPEGHQTAPMPPVEGTDAPTQIMRLSNPRTGETIDVYLPFAVQALGKLASALGDDWTGTMLPADAPRPSTIAPESAPASRAPDDDPVPDRLLYDPWASEDDETGAST